MKSKYQVITDEQKHLNNVIQTIEEMIEKNKEDDRRKRNDPDLPGNLLTSKRIKEYQDARNLLYFGRVDIFDENGKEETCYIGEVAIARDDIDNIIYNWQSPIGDAFGGFYGGDGTITYEVEDKVGTYKNTLTVLLKRQLNIKKDIVLDFSDVHSDQAIKPSSTKNEDNKVNMIIDEDAQYLDQFLINLLNETSQTHGIKKVIATIQKEQNEVIRLGIKVPILIQGVAGSGKSTIALNRISFLLYRYRQSLKASNILILAPNKMFLTYITNVLPGLDISDIQQKTFTSLAKGIITTLGEVVEPYEILAGLVNSELDPKQVIPLSTFKGSIEFKEIIDQYITYLESQIHTSIKEFKLYDQFKKKYYEFTTDQIVQELKNYYHLPYEVRRRKVYSIIENWKNELLSKRIMELDSEFESAKEIWVNTLPMDSDIRMQTFIALEQASKYKVDLLRNEFNKNWKEHKANQTLLSTKKIYDTILQPELLKNMKPGLSQNILQSLETKKNKKVSYEDLAALLYIDSKINGNSIFYDYIVIDEAQDLSPFQIYVLKQYSRSLTILGDETQSIYSFTGIDSWEQITNTVYQNEEIKKANLTVSYRSTFEIMETANQIISNGNLPYQKVVPFNRHGDKIVCKSIVDEENLLSSILDSIKEFLEKGYKRIAIIHKDAARSEVLYKALQENGVPSLQLVLNPDDSLKESIIIIPSYLVKGLEFDAVIIPNANEENYHSSTLDAKLLYISVTRPHHALHIYYYKKVSPLLKSLVVEEKKQRIGIL
jgi:DNA helicase II / ATP-dependent DNA helicase PcrA